jgi:transposase
MDATWLRERLDGGASYEELARETGRSASTVAYWARKFGLMSSHVARHGPRGDLDETLLRDLVRYGFSIREIAAGVDRSPATVRHWLARHGLKTNRLRRSPAQLAVPEDATTADLRCWVHGVTRHVRRAGGWRCAECRSAAVTKRRRAVKRALVREAGGACILCGYERCIAALHFHHLDPATKSFTLGVVGVSRSWATARAEAKKCVLLCANCHAEVESGVARVPDRLPGV